MALNVGNLLGLGGPTTGSPPVAVNVPSVVDLGVSGTLVGDNSGSLLNVNLDNLLGLGGTGTSGGVLDGVLGGSNGGVLGGVLGGSGSPLDLSGLLGGANGGAIDLSNLLGTSGLNINDLLNLTGGNTSLLGTVGNIVNDLLGGTGNITVDLGNTLTNIGIDLTHYHIPGGGPDNPVNPPPGTASDGVQIFHTARGDVMIGTAKDDTMTGNVGNDHFFGLGGNDKIDGSYGTDTAFYRGAMSDYTVGINNGVLTITDHTASRDGVDTVSNVERIAFTDSTLAFDINGDAGQAYRIYQAAFDRTPDQPGVSFWTHRLDTGETLKQVASEFVGSAEFQAKYGANPSNATFINALYQNVLDRQADAAGVAYWTNEMNKGMSRGDILASFSESAENHAKVDPGLQSGIHLDYGVFV